MVYDGEHVRVLTTYEVLRSGSDPPKIPPGTCALARAQARTTDSRTRLPLATFLPPPFLSCPEGTAPPSSGGGEMMCLGIWLFATVVPGVAYCFRGSLLARLAQI